jgi:hypothetical protein
MIITKFNNAKCSARNITIVFNIASMDKGVFLFRGIKKQNSLVTLFASVQANRHADTGFSIYATCHSTAQLPDSLLLF